MSRHSEWGPTHRRAIKVVSQVINYNWVNKQIPWGIYVPRLIFIWGVKNGKVNQRTTGPVSNT